MTFARLLSVSRPRFWIYVFGPYIVGLAAGAATLADLTRPAVVLFGLFFLLPANLLIYGVNDIFDYETDCLNAKKAGYEDLVPPDDRPALWRAIAITSLPFAAALPLAKLGAALALIAFLFFSIEYSAPPLRAKARPLFDSAFNVLYICPGIVAYFLAGGQNLSLRLVAAAWCWAMAMHAYSAVPDISADRAAGVPTVANLLGLHRTLLGCATLYALSALLSCSVLGTVSIILGAVYLGLMLLSLRAGDEAGVMAVYRYFPITNTLCGAVLFFATFLTRFPHLLKLS